MFPEHHLQKNDFSGGSVDSSQWILSNEDIILCIQEQVEQQEIEIEVFFWWAKEEDELDLHSVLWLAGSEHQLHLEHFSLFFLPQNCLC